MNARTLSLLARTLYAAVIVAAAILGFHEAVLFSTLVFFGTLVSWWVASRTRDDSVLYHDALIVVLFMLTLALGVFDVYELESTAFGVDKLFHFLAGVAIAGMAWYAAPVVIRGEHSRERLAFVAIACMLVFFGWEVYEWFVLEFIARKGVLTLTDTWVDIVVDAAGAYVALRFTQRF